VRALARRPEPTLSQYSSGGHQDLIPAIEFEPRRSSYRSRNGKKPEYWKWLLSADGRVVSAEELLERVWDEDVDPITTAVRTSIKKKLRQRLGKPNPIET